MMELLFRDDAYLRECAATVVSVDEAGIRLDRTVFYPTGGGQPGDTGVLVAEDGAEIAIADTRKGRDLNDVVHIPADGAALPAAGARVTARIDWERRYKHMRMHGAMHVLSSLVDGEVTGGQVGAEKSRLDFNVPSASLDKVALTETLNRIVVEDRPFSERWISDEELAANPGLVKTMSVKPPMGYGKVRLIEIAGVDLQPCGGTHIRSTGEIGAVTVAKIENKGRQNRRVVIRFC